MDSMHQGGAGGFAQGVLLITTTVQSLYSSMVKLFSNSYSSMTTCPVTCNYTEGHHSKTCIFCSLLFVTTACPECHMT